MIEGKKVPSVIFRTRVRDESMGGENPFRWQDVDSNEIFKEKYSENDVLLFILEGTTRDARLIVLDSKTLKFKSFLNLDPWTEYKPGD